MISFKRYVDIVSGVGGGAAVRTRDFILRLFSLSSLVPAGTVIEMTEADDVKAYFGSSSPEYARALWYFGFISKLITAPQKISFARFALTADVARIFGSTAARTVSQFTGIAAGSFNLTLGAYTSDVTGINFSAAGTLSAVAADIQTAIRAVVAGGVDWTAATVTYNAVAQRFELVAGGVAGAMPIAVASASTGTPIAGLLGWDATGVFSPGVAAQAPADAFTSSVAVSNNFGTFNFMSTLLLADMEAVATANATYNNSFMFLVPEAIADAATNYAGLQAIPGVALTVSPLAAEFPELLPAAVLASTVYANRNSVQNYMFQQAALTPSVNDDATANTLDANRANYYGVTQTAGQLIAFYQRGVLTGVATDPVDMNTYANEMWLKDTAGAQLLSMLLSLPRVSANLTGRGQVLATMQGVVGQALNNGTISVGKPFTTAQKLFITNQTGDANAWQQVYRLGYWLDCAIESYVTIDGRTEFKAVYSLIYSKDDDVRLIEGTHTLI